MRSDSACRQRLKGIDTVTAVTPPPPVSGGIPRRTLAKGAAWAVPAVAVGAAAPAYATSPGPTTSTTTTVAECVREITNDSINWNVDGVVYAAPTCSSYCSHKDVRLTFHVTPCATPVTIRVSNIPGASTWCAWNTGTGTLTKTVPANTNSTLTFPATNDVIIGGGSCTITAYESANDGMHINPCSDGPFFKYEIWYASTTTGSPAVTGYWGDASNPPKPGNVIPGSPSDVEVCRASVSNPAATFTATWSAVAGADTYDLQYQVRNSNDNGWNTAQTVNNLTATSYTSGSVANGTRRIQVRVRASNCRGDSSYSGWVPLDAGTTVTCGAFGRAAAGADTFTTTELPAAATTTTTTAVATVETSTTTGATVESTTTTELPTG